MMLSKDPGCLLDHAVMAVGVADVSYSDFDSALFNELELISFTL